MADVPLSVVSRGFLPVQVDEGYATGEIQGSLKTASILGNWCTTLL